MAKSTRDLTTLLPNLFDNFFDHLFDMETPSKRKRQQKIKTIQHLLQEDNLADIFTLFPTSPIGLYAYCTKYHITLPEHLTPYHFDSTIDSLIEQGKSQEEIGASQNKTREWARQYIMSSGWYGQWVQKRQEQTQQFQDKKEKATRTQLLSLLSQRLVHTAATESWAHQKAAEYFVQVSKIKHKTPFSAYLTLFQTYEQAQQQGEKLTLQELAKRAGFAGATSVKKIFAAVNVEPMFGNCIRRPKIKLEAMARDAQMGLSAIDIGYFVDIPSTNAWNYISTHYGSATPTTVIELRYTNIKSMKRELKINFSLASQIYEAADAGFSVDEIRELLPIMSGGVKHDSNKIKELLNCRSEIEPTLITLLQKLYDLPQLDTPYKINL